MERKIETKRNGVLPLKCKFISYQKQRNLER